MKPKQLFFIIVMLFMLLTVTNEPLVIAQTKTNGKIVARTGAVVQLTNKNRATRIITNGTKIRLITGNTIIPATLNDSLSSRELISRLPITVSLRQYSHDYCGVMSDPLPFDEADARWGWLNGDIAFAYDGNYFTILYKDEDISEQYGHIVNLGVVDYDLPLLDTLGESITLRIELAD